MSVDIREGLFGQTVVLCEGETEVNCLEIWNLHLKYEFNKNGIALIASQGKFSMIDLAEFYTNFKIPVYVIFDSDSIEKGDNRIKHAKNNKWLMEFAGARGIEFPDTSISNAYSVFSPDFETIIRGQDEYYKSFEKEVNEELGLEASRNKGIRAKYSSLKYIENKIPAPKFIPLLLDSIRDFHQGAM
jgi:predicted ATP-dependent endonuclease of OLD family